MKKAFSLIELLISLIIISLITASLAPIITKKIKHQNLSLAGGFGGQNCKKFDSSGRCLACDDTKCTFCTTQAGLLIGQYVDPKTSCDVKTCEEGYSSCLEENINCQEGYGYNEETKSCIKCASGTASKGGKTACLPCPDNCSICSSSNNCTKCNEGYSETDGKCTKKGEDCYTVAYSKICIAKFNAGDPGGLEIPEGLVTFTTTISSGATHGGQHTQAICWRGNTANQETCDSSNGSYSGCHRTVCTWYAADKICRHHGWRLPSTAELSSFLAYSKDKGDDGLQICNGLEGDYGTSWCGGVDGCPQAWYGFCTPNAIWSREYTSGLVQIYDYYLSGESWVGPHLTYPSGAWSVRCVKDL